MINHLTLLREQLAADLQASGYSRAMSIQLAGLAVHALRGVAGGKRIYVPSLHRSEARARQEHVYSLLATGATVAEVAEVSGYSPRWSRRLLGEYLSKIRKHLA